MTRVFSSSDSCFPCFPMIHKKMAFWQTDDKMMSFPVLCKEIFELFPFNTRKHSLVYLYLYSKAFITSGTRNPFAAIEKVHSFLAWCCKNKILEIAEQLLSTPVSTPSLCRSKISVLIDIGWKRQVKPRRTLKDLTLYHLKKKAFENILGKKENAGAFSSFSTMYSTHSKTHFNSFQLHQFFRLD